MRLKLIACNVLYREFSLVISKSKNYIDATYLKQGLHNTTGKLHDILQREIDKIDKNEDDYTSFHEEKDFDAILLGYGLCSNSILGLSSSRYKIVVPKAHDCITMLLGSKEKYKELFDSKTGIYWYSRGWIETAYMPSKERLDYLKKYYIDNYGEDNGEFLFETEISYIKNYKYAAFVGWEELSDSESKNYTKKCAGDLNWEYEEIKGKQTLISNLINGNWNKEDFIIVEKNEKIPQSIF